MVAPDIAQLFRPYLTGQEKTAFWGSTSEKVLK